MRSGEPSCCNEDARRGHPPGVARHGARMSAVVVPAMPDGVLAGERERLLAMVDILEAVPPEDVLALARRSTFARLEERDAVVIYPDEHAQRLLLLLEGRAQVYEESDHPGQEL